jgi:Reverse transcriptase (RNA-dependent DNA polymerase)
LNNSKNKNYSTVTTVRIRIITGSVDIVYLDFAKAFDKVPPQRLLAKLKSVGVEGQVLEWIKGWLVGLKQRVVVKGKFSGWREVLSGVPQGSVLGPLLFSIFINDLDSAATAEQIIKKFADDTKVGQILEGPHSHTELQATLDRLCKWAVDWGMQFNVEKCHVMHVGRGNPNHEYSMNSTRLATTKEERDVGVIISENLKPAAQCKKAAQTASSVLGQIHRSFHYRDRHTYVRIYKQYLCASTSRICVTCLVTMAPRRHRLPGKSAGESSEGHLQPDGQGLCRPPERDWPTHIGEKRPTCSRHIRSSVTVIKRCVNSCSR